MLFELSCGIVYTIRHPCHFLYVKITGLYILNCIHWDVICVGISILLFLLEKGELMPITDVKGMLL